MRGRLTLQGLEQVVAEGSIDTVLVAQTDMQGRLMGKRFQAEFFLASAHGETHGCNYLLANDYEMETVLGYKATSWAAGYGDYVMRPTPDAAPHPLARGHGAGARRRPRPPRPRRVPHAPRAIPAARSPASPRSATAR